MHPSPFAIRGVVEGFYGAYYTFPERNDLIRFIGRHGFNLYIYGPKNDRQHRMRWWEPYPPEIMAQFGHTAEIARAAGVDFCYAISFGVPVNYASDDDFRVITEKLEAFYRLGVRTFGVLLDDITGGFQHEVNRRNYRSLAAAHIDLCNRLYAWLQRLDTQCRLLVCPSEYCGQAPFGTYLQECSELLHPAVDLFYSGPQICSRTILSADALGFAQAAGRLPLLWDNYPVNDLQMKGELHIGPIRNRDPYLYNAVKGIVVNAMLQPEASKIPLLTYADYLRDPHGYDPERSWHAALEQAGGPISAGPLRHVAATSLYSCLGTPEAPDLESRAGAALAALEAGESATRSRAVEELADYLDGLDESCYHLKYRMGNLALRQNLLPWIEALEDWIWIGKRSIQALRVREQGLDDSAPSRFVAQALDEVDRRRRSGGALLLPLARYVLHHCPAATGPPSSALHQDASDLADPVATSRDQA